MALDPSGRSKQQEPIAVIGMGCRLPGGVESSEDFWDLLVEGREAIGEIPLERWDPQRHHDPDPRRPLHQHVCRAGLVEGIDLFDPGFFGISGREAQCMDPQQRMLLEVCWRAIEGAGQPLEQLRGRAVGVFMGISSADYSSLLWASEDQYLTPDNEPFILTGNTGCIAANRISYAFDFKGPSFTVDTACSSSLVAVHLACESLRSGESELALAGGVQALIHPGIQMSFCKAGLLSPSGRCRSFDADADGYVRSEGSGAVVLKPLREALRDGDPIEAVIRGTAVNSDGRSQGMAAPSQKAQMACVQTAYDAAGLSPTAAQYVEAHGTGTRQGDPTELRALGAVLGADRSKAHPCLVGSVKSNLGHGETAAGITGLIKTVLCLKRRQIPASLHFTRPHPSLDLPGLGLKVSTALVPFPAKNQELVASVSSFGFGGTNAHVVLSAASEIEPESAKSSRATAPEFQLLWLSARSPEALQRLRNTYADWIEAYPKVEIADLCASTHLRRSQFPHAVALIVSSRQELLNQLRGQAAAAWCGDVPSKGRAFLPVALQRLQLKTLPTGGACRSLLEELVQALADGAPMEWPFWHEGADWCWVQPPGHPFLRSRFWWSSIETAAKDIKASLWVDHLGLTSSGTPLQGALRLQRIDLPGATQHWSVELDACRVPDLKHHLLGGQPVFAAAGYLALVLDWLQDRKQPLHLGAVQLERPLWLHAGPVKLQALWNGKQLTLHSRPAADSSDWQLHGQVQLAADPGETLLLPALGLNPDVELERQAPEPLYDALQQLGLGYGQTYRPIRELWVDGLSAEAILTRPDGAADRCLIDGCFQLVAAVIAQAPTAAQLLLPTGVEAVAFGCWPLPDELRCRLQLRVPGVDEDGTEARGHQLADLELRDMSGAPIGSIRGLQLRPLSRTLLDLMVPMPPAIAEARILEDGWSELAVGALSEWSVVPSEPISVIALGGLPTTVQAWCDQQAIVPMCIEVAADPASVLPALVQTLQALPLQSSRQLLVLLPPVVSPAVGAVQAAVRCLAQDCPAWRCSTVTFEVESMSSTQWQRLLGAMAGDAELRWCGEDRIETRGFQPLDADRFRILADGSGRLEGLVQAPLPLAQLLPGELEIAVEATGLNFRDVLNALGLLQTHNQSLGLRADAQLPFGGEAVGRVVAVGPGIDPSFLGTRMLAALTLGSLASHVTCRADLCVPWPEPLDPVLGASLSTAYLTAEHGLEQLAQLQPGETVLIHAAAGGVGQAALQVALRCGARIFATASASKQAALLEQGVDAVFDSRSTAFADQVLEHTGGRGVDVVLNSLKGEWVDASFRALSEEGRFVELGKLEIWSDQEVRERRPDVGYFRFDLLELAASDPQPLRQRLLALVDAVQQGQLKALPTSSFPLEQRKDAFRLMAQGRHVGKLVITLPTQAPPCRIRSDGTYLIVGAFGGLGLRLQRWLVEQGARALLLVGRQLPQPDSDAEQRLQSLRDLGIDVEALTWADLPRALNVLPEHQPLRGVIQAAGSLWDQRIEAIDAVGLETVLSAKWGVAQQLQQVQQQRPEAWLHLDFNLVFSSLAAAVGSPGQLVYGAANGALEAGCRDVDGSEQPDGPLRLAIQWGPWAGTGMAAGLEKRFEAVGLKPLLDGEAFEALERLLQRGRSGVVTVMAADWPRLVSQALPRQAAWFQALIPEASGRSEAQVRAQLEALPMGQRRPWLLATLQDLLAGVMEEPSAQLDPHTSLFDLGLDSLMAAEFAAVVQESLGWRLDLAALSDAPCLDDLAALALERLSTDGEASVQAALDLDQEAQLPEGWSRPNLPALEAPSEQVLLTGASGFLGAYLLAGQLERWPELRVRCLVRASSLDQGSEKLERNLRRYGLWNPAWSERLEVVLGDLAQPKLGLDPDQFAALGQGLCGILHNGAQLSQMASYSQLAAANVGGTRELLHLATAASPLRFELISSVAVFEADAYRDQVIAEADSLADWQGIQLGYSQTKWVTDRMVRRAGEAGLPVTIYRPPLIAGPSNGRFWHEGDLLQRLLQGCLALGASPDLAWELDVVPVDYVADAISALAWSGPAKGCCFHLQHPEPLMLNALLGQITDAQSGWRILPMQDWISEIDQNSANPLQPLLPFLRQRWGEDGLTYPERNCKGQRARPSCGYTTQLLAEQGVRCPNWNQLVSPWASALLQQNSLV